MWNKGRELMPSPRLTLTFNKMWTANIEGDSSISAVQTRHLLATLLKWPVENFSVYRKNYKSVNQYFLEGIIICLIAVIRGNNNLPLLGQQCNNEPMYHIAAQTSYILRVSCTVAHVYLWLGRTTVPFAESPAHPSTLRYDTISVGHPS